MEFLKGFLGPEGYGVFIMTIFLGAATLIKTVCESVYAKFKKDNAQKVAGWMGTALVYIPKIIAFLTGNTGEKNPPIEPSAK